MDREVEDLLRNKLDEVISLMIEQPANMAEYFELVEQKVADFSQYMNIEKVTCDSDIAGNIFVPEGEKGTKVIFDHGSDVEEENKVVFSYPIIDGGLIQFTIYPVKHHIFDDDERKWLKKLADLVYVSGGKTRLFVLCQKATNSDLMTQLPNIESFVAQIRKLIAMKEITKYNAYYFNCKNFKYFNAVFGYNSGGEVLKLYSKKLHEFCTDQEMVARLGGDNFVALIKKEHADSFMNMLKGTEVIYRFNDEDKKLNVSVVAGIYEIERAENTGDIMMPIALAFQAAKQVLHKDFVFYDGTVRDQIIEAQKIVRVMHKCIEKGEFIAYYQPKIDVNSGKIYGAEALVRWFHNGELLSPAVFIPAMERNGDICVLDFEMLRQVCVKLKEWMDVGKELPVISVNFSRWHLSDPYFAEKIEQIVDRYQIPHECIEIELTETADIEGFHNMNRLFNMLSEKGFLTAIDDFGTGYSSLNMLLKSNVDIIKIDKAFIDEIDQPEAESERKLLQNIVNIASDLEKSVIAEGVETKAQCDCLFDMGCTKVQGYYYYKPMAVAEFEKMI